MGGKSAPANKLLWQQAHRRCALLSWRRYHQFRKRSQTTVTKAEAALSAKIKCEDFRKNSDGTWTSGPNTKIGVNAFPNHTFDTQGVSIGGADLATVLNRKCGS
jgi:hypothetical protein